jgi:beta-lactamase superfamily II metal-dependent hydrolase
MATLKKKVPATSDAGTKPAARKTAKVRTTARSAPAAASSSEDVKGLRVRMFRVGFGDFFLLTVPTPNGARHILIDCGVHARDLNSIRDAVAQMAEDCGSRLALVIMTHRHADHISGFATCSDIFGQITVDRVWMPWFEDPSNKTAKAFQTSLTALAGRLSLQLAARNSDSELARMAENITGAINAATGGSSNQKALDVLHNGFKNTPERDYYRAGDAPTLPQDLVSAGLTAQILGPPQDLSLVAQMTNKNQQYLVNNAQSDDGKFVPFSTSFSTDAAAYPQDAFRLFPPEQIASVIASVQPDALAAQAMAADKTLNNQSLVVLFSFGGKNLLFAGDAQWGNWENFLYGGAYGTPGHTTITAQAQAILEKIDFYKVGHHGSANATPKDAVAAMRLGCVGMCSTQIHAYNEVPRGPLLTALSKRMNGQIARSDQVAASADVPPESSAGVLPDLFNKSPTGMLYIDYDFPTADRIA